MTGNARSAGNLSFSSDCAGLGVYHLGSENGPFSKGSILVNEFVDLLVNNDEYWGRKLSETSRTICSLLFLVFFNISLKITLGMMKI